MQKKPTKNKPERQDKTPTGPIAPVITSSHTEPKNPIAGVPFKMIIEGGDFGDNPDCIILPKKLLRQDLPPLLELCRADNKMIYESCYLLEQTPGHIVWQGTLKEPGVYEVRAGAGVKGWPICYSKAVELKIGFAPSQSGPGEGSQARQKGCTVTVKMDAREIYSPFVGKPQNLDTTPLKLLERLNKDIGRTVSKDNLVTWVWKDGNVPFEGELYTGVKKLRQAFKKLKIPATIQTIHKAGYKLVAGGKVIFDIK